MGCFYLLYGRLSAMWSAVRVCRHGWFDSKGGFLYSRSSIGRALVSKTKGCRLGPCRECQTLHEFREVVAVSAKRLTDRQKKKIIADYVQLQSYARTAKLNDVAESTVRKIVKDNPKCADLCALKKEQNTQDMLSYLGSKRGEAQDLLGMYLQAMADPDKIAEATLPQLSTAFGTIVDKFAMLGDQNSIEIPDDGLVEALNAAADLSPPDDVEMLPEEEDDDAEK